MWIGNPRWPPPQDIDYHWTLWENVQMPSSQKLQILLKPNGHLGSPIGIKNIHFVEDLPMTIPGQFGFNCPSGFREEAF
jgi:hypothetical protein